MPGATVSVYFSAIGARSPGHVFTTQQDGSFEGKIWLWDKQVPAVALDKSTNRGACVVLDQGNIGQDIVFKLSPLVVVKGKVVASAPVKYPVFIFMDVTDQKVPLVGCPPGYEGSLLPGQVYTPDETEHSGSFEFRVPPGDYQLRVFSGGILPILRPMTITPRSDPVDLGEIGIVPRLYMRAGSVPPAMNLTDARGVRPDIDLQDYKGRYVLLEFWAYW